MMNETLKVIGLFILSAAWLDSTALRAQTTWTLPASGSAGSGSTAVSFQFRTDGSIVEEGAGTSSLSNSDLESASRFIWYPAQAALRAGSGLSSETVSGVGQYSVALGYQTIASGLASIALGQSASAGGSNGVSIGDYSSASGSGSTAIGIDSVASGTTSVSLGNFSTASNSGSLTFGDGCTSSGSYALALGNTTTASGSYSTALGSLTLSTGTYATAAGYNTSANSYNSLVIGQYNKGLSEASATPSTTSWVATDPLFEIGNGPGTGGTPKSDAVVVFKNGDEKVQGIITAAPGGNIPMYSGS